MRGVANCAEARCAAARCAAPLMLDAAQLWSVYEAAADSNSLATDMVTAGTINVMSDSIAQATEGTNPFASRATPTTGGPDFRRIARFGSFGSVDGALSHLWFFALDAVVGEEGTITETILKVVADQLVYTPIFCAWFLAAFVLLEGRDVRSIPSVLRADWFELYRGNAGFFLPLTGLIYGFVPRDERVLAFGLGSLVYTWILSLWNSARDEARNEPPVPPTTPATPVPPTKTKQRSRSGSASMVMNTLLDDGSRSKYDNSDDLPPLLDQWTRLEDGRIEGFVDGRTLWIRPALLEERNGQPSRIRSANGEYFELGARRGGELQELRVAEEGLPVSIIASTWPALVVLATLALSNAYGVVPGTCIGPAATL